MDGIHSRFFVPFRASSADLSEGAIAYVATRYYRIHSSGNKSLCMSIITSNTCNTEKRNSFLQIGISRVIKLDGIIDSFLTIRRETSLYSCNV
jgi:hypothetical protein